MRVAIIGNGVVGLTTAIKLLKAGREVVIYSKDPEHKREEDTVSIVACALWQPYKLFTNLEEYEKDKFELVKKVSFDSLKEFENSITSNGSSEIGVYAKNHFEYSSESIYLKNSHKLKKDFYYIDILREFWAEKGEYNAIVDETKLKNKPPFKAIDKNNNEVDFKYLHGYKTYVIDPSLFLKFLTIQFKSLGGEIVNKNINLDELKKLKEKIIFNCSGISGYSLISNKNTTIGIRRKILPKKGVLLLYNLKSQESFENTIVLDELTILCRKNELTIGTGEIKEGEDPEILIERLKCHAVQFAKAKNIERFGFDTFLLREKINIEKPSSILIGARPYFPDGQGYVLNKEIHQSNSKHNFTLYNNFGHGGSGVTLSWGCANEITNLYLQNVQNALNSKNKNRKGKPVSEFSIEFAHFEVRKLHNLSDQEIDELVHKENQRLHDVFSMLNLLDRKVSVSVLIDDKEAQNDEETIRKLVASLTKIGVDYVAYESRLVTYVTNLKDVLPPNIAREFNNYLYNHYKLGCAQDIFVWYCLRFGISDFNFSDEVIVPISKDALDGGTPFVGNTLITLLDKSIKNYEDKADEYLTKSFGFEIATSIRRFYH